MNQSPRYFIKRFDALDEDLKLPVCAIPDLEGACAIASALNQDVVDRNEVSWCLVEDHLYSSFDGYCIIDTLYQ